MKKLMVAKKNKAGEDGDCSQKKVLRSVRRKKNNRHIDVGR